MKADLTTVIQRGATVAETFPGVLAGTHSAASRGKCLAGALHGCEHKVEHPVDSVHRSAGQCP